MDLLEYDDVDPREVLRLNLLGLGYALTPERVALIRRLDPRPLPCFAIYAREEGTLAAQVGLYRLPLVTTAGPEDAGALCAVCTLPGFGRRGLATRLLDAAHARLRAAGLRVAVLGTTRSRVAYSLYLKQGYEEVFVPAAIVAPVLAAPSAPPLRAERAQPAGLPLADALFDRVAAGQLGFARRHPGFLAMMVATGEIGSEEVWLLRRGDELVGYALARTADAVLELSHLLLASGTDPAAAVAALARELPAPQALIRIDQPAVGADLSRAGYPAPQATWATVMLKSLLPEFTIADAQRAFGFGTDRFLVSRLDVT